MKKKLRILIDMDGVLVNFLGHWLNYLELFHGIRLKPEQVTNWALHECECVKAIARENGWDAKELSRRLYGCFQMPGFWRTAPLMKGASQFMASVQNEFEEVYIVTSPSGGMSAKEKTEYIEEVFGPNVKHVITKHKFLVRGDVLIDDHPENCYRWLKENPDKQVIMPASPYCLTELQKLPADASDVLAGHNRITADPMDGKGFSDVLEVLRRTA